MFVYEGKVKKSLFALKFFNQTWIGLSFGKLLAEFYKEQGLPDVDLVIPIPLHFFRRLHRGYNQAEIIGKSFCKYTHYTYASTCIRRHKWTKPQKDLSDVERVWNMENAFSLKKNAENAIKGKKILLIDDIYTTGTTMDSCSKLLYEFGAVKVFCSTIAIGNGI
jgi:competence protein ComFC